MNRDPAESNAACCQADFVDEIDTLDDEARQLLSDAIRAAKLTLPVQQMVFEREVLRICAGPVAKTMGAHCGDSRSTQEIIARIYDVVSRSKNPPMLLACFPVVFSLPCGGGLSEAAIAKNYGVERATISAICIDLKKTFGVPPGRGMRTNESCGVYAKRQEGKRAKPFAKPWIHKGLFASLAKA